MRVLVSIASGVSSGIYDQNFPPYVNYHKNKEQILKTKSNSSCHMAQDIYARLYVETES